MKAIETRYRGYRFRSRLEARWAVFFETFRVPWEYEPQGFSGNNVAYLPDFLVGGRWHVEVKPGVATPKDLTIEKWEIVVRAGGTVLVVFGPPEPIGGKTAGLVFSPDSDGEIDDVRAFSFGECRRCGALCYLTDDGDYSMLCVESCTSERRPIQDTIYSAAVDKARGARFEHGEHP